jgi:hypothetical protein
VLLEATCLVAQPIREQAVGESGTESKATGINIPYRQAGVARERQPASGVRPRCSCNKSSRSSLEGRSSRSVPVRAMKSHDSSHRDRASPILTIALPRHFLPRSPADVRQKGDISDLLPPCVPACLRRGCTLVAVVLAHEQIDSAPKHLTRKASCQSQQGNNGNACPWQPHASFASPTGVSSRMSWQAALGRCCQT